MNSDEYLGGMSSDRPLKALVPGGSSVPILPADLKQQLTVKTV
jgi:NADH-quinone oxidoreductase subunit F